ncbi:MAG: DUF1552 domain-containing protein [Myxococcota bacterium]|nr:DUF1552 domain-containing protein [Myxococcota bacterium]
MTWSTRRSGRRLFLGGVAGTAISLPFLPSLMSRTRAQATGAPRRFLCVYTPNGQHPDQWLPTGGERDFTLSPVLESLAPYRDRVAVLHGLRGSHNHMHGHAECLTGAPGADDSFVPTGPSLDQLLAARTARETAIPSLELSAGTDSNATGVISYSPGVLPVPPVSDPRHAFDRLFLLASGDPAALERLRSQRRSVLDSLTSDFAELERALSAPERRVLDAHLGGLREQELRLAEPLMLDRCELPPGPGAPSGGGAFPMNDAVRAHVDTIAAAFACDLTRVATLMIGGSGSTRRYGWVGVDEDFHEIAHNSSDNAYEKLLAINQWHGETFAYLLGKLDAIPEDDGTVLDHTVVLWTNELGLQPFGHARSSVPIVLAGGTDVLRSGRFLDLSGAHYHDLLLTLARAMGMEVETFGTEGRTPISTLLA